MFSLRQEDALMIFTLHSDIFSIKFTLIAVFMVFVCSVNKFIISTCFIILYFAEIDSRQMFCMCLSEFSRFGEFCLKKNDVS